MQAPCLRIGAKRIPSFLTPGRFADSFSKFSYLHQRRSTLMRTVVVRLTLALALLVPIAIFGLEGVQAQHGHGGGGGGGTTTPSGPRNQTLPPSPYQPKNDPINNKPDRGPELYTCSNCGRAFYSGANLPVCPYCQKALISTGGVPNGTMSADAGSSSSNDSPSGMSGLTLILICVAVLGTGSLGLLGVGALILFIFLAKKKKSSDDDSAPHPKKKRRRQANPA
jgi:hypothetical protein